MLNLGFDIEEYHSFEILPAAIKVSTKNFPFIIHHGDVNSANFSQFKGFDLVIGGSPCQNRSRARKESKHIHSGLKGDKSHLFWKFAEAVEIIKPKYFMLENVVSEIPDDDNTISETLGVLPVKINSNLFSAQDRERLYWTNINILKLPTCNNTVIQDILEDNVAEKYYYKKPFTYNGEDKKIIATLNINSMEMSKRVYNPKCKCGTLTCISGGYQEKKVYDNNRVRKLTPLEYERLQTYPDRYTGGCGLSYTARCSLCGNGWTYEVVKHIFSGIKC